MKIIPFSPFSIWHKMTWGIVSSTEAHRLLSASQQGWGRRIGPALVVDTGDWGREEWRASLDTPGLFVLSPWWSHVADRQFLFTGNQNLMVFATSYPQSSINPRNLAGLMSHQWAIRVLHWWLRRCILLVNDALLLKKENRSNAVINVGFGRQEISMIYDSFRNNYVM